MMPRHLLGGTALDCMRVRMWCTLLRLVQQTLECPADALREGTSHRLQH
jgi:hypothetical protein